MTDPVEDKTAATPSSRAIHRHPPRQRKCTAIKNPSIKQTATPPGKARGATDAGQECPRVRNPCPLETLTGVSQKVHPLPEQVGASRKAYPQPGRPSSALLRAPSFPRAGEMQGGGQLWFPQETWGRRDQEQRFHEKRRKNLFLPQMKLHVIARSRVRKAGSMLPKDKRGSPRKEWGCRCGVHRERTPRRVRHPSRGTRRRSDTEGCQGDGMVQAAKRASSAGSKTLRRPGGTSL